MDLINLIPIVGMPIVRSVAGWLENSLKDGVINTFEWAQLGETIVRVGIIGGAAFFGLNGLGIDVSALGASAGAIVFDFILKAIKNK